MAISNRPQGASEWTIYDAETGDAVTFKAFLGADVTSESKIITSPVEQGSFVAYNKTQSPFEVSVEGAISGEPDQLNAALEALDGMTRDTRLYNIVTPDRVYKSVNLYKLEYSRTADDGADLIVFSARFAEIRQAVGMYGAASVRLGKRSNRGRQQAPEESVAHMVGRWIKG